MQNRVNSNQPKQVVWVGRCKSRLLTLFQHGSYI